MFLRPKQTHSKDVHTEEKQAQLKLMHINSPFLNKKCIEHFIEINHAISGL